MIENNAYIQAKDSITGYLTTHLSAWTNNSNNVLPTAIRKGMAEVGYALLMLAGVVETVAKPILGLLCALFSLLFLNKRFFNKAAAPLFAGMFFSSLSTALAASKLYTNIFGEKKSKEPENRSVLEQFTLNSHNQCTDYFVSQFWISYPVEPLKFEEESR